MNEPKRRFFSGDSLQHALMQAANYFNLPPEEIAYRSIEKRHGFIKVRRKAVIEVDPAAPRREPQAAEPAATRAASLAGELATPPPLSPAGEGSSGVPGPVAPGRGLEEKPRAAPREEREGFRPGRRRGSRHGAREPRGREERRPPGNEGGQPARQGTRPSGERQPGSLEESQPAGQEERQPTVLEERQPAGNEGRYQSGREARYESVHDERRAPRQRARHARVIPAAGASDQDGGLVALPERPRSTSERYPLAEGPKAEAAARGVELLLRLAGLSLSPRICQGEDRLEIDLLGSDTDWCFADDGEMLMAIEHLLPRIIRSLSGEAILCRVDCDNFHEIREERLRSLAQRVADEVRQRGRSRTLVPMNPADRRIIHVTLADDPGVVTESEGDGYFKRITVRPA